MSGGSFDYACHDTWDLSKAEDLLRKLCDMRGRILTVYPDAIPYLNDMIDFIVQMRGQYHERGQKIFDLLENIEWNYSGDRDKERVIGAIEKLKASHPLPEGGQSFAYPTMIDLVKRLESLEEKLKG